MPSFMPDGRLTRRERARIDRICAIRDELQRTCEADDIPDVMHARVRKVMVLQPNPRYL
jgi:hypothetical protein